VVEREAVPVVFKRVAAPWLTEDELLAEMMSELGSSAAVTHPAQLRRYARDCHDR